MTRINRRKRQSNEVGMVTGGGLIQKRLSLGKGEENVFRNEASIRTRGQCFEKYSIRRLTVFSALGGGGGVLVGVGYNLISGGSPLNCGGALLYCSVNHPEEIPAVPHIRCSTAVLVNLERTRCLGFCVLELVLFIPNTSLDLYRAT